MPRVCTSYVVLFVCLIFHSHTYSMADTLHVDRRHQDASDDNPGSAQSPLATIGRAAKLAGPGDTVLVHAGVYRETVTLDRSGTAEAPIRFLALPGEKVVLNGTEPIVAQWSADREDVYKAKVAGPVRQLFVDGRMVGEARWPNRGLDQLWDRNTWAQAGEGSRYGKMVDPNLAATGVDFTGATAVLNVAHQFYSWTRTVTRHDAGSDTFEYAKDLTGITHYADKTKTWEDDQYYLVGKLEALDTPGEWFFDTDAETLYLWAPQSDNPVGHTLEHKVRDYGFIGKNIRHVEISGFHFFGCTFSFAAARHLVVDGCHLVYPSFARRFEEKGVLEDRVASEIIGDGNAIRRSSFAYGSTTGLTVRGSGNLIEDNLLHDFCWDGSLKFPGVSISGDETGDKTSRNLVRHNTTFNLGNAVIGYRGPGNTIEYNHVYDGGLACKDVALVYTGSPSTAGNIVRYNWVHGCYTGHVHSGGLFGGLGIRGDDQTRSLTVHHNVVWNCGRDGIIIKGDHNRAVNNTVFGIGTREAPGNYVNLHTVKEPEKWWRTQHPLLEVQNANSLIANNAAFKITGDNRGVPYPFDENLKSNYQGEDLKLVDPARFDFRPRDDSPLVDAGTPVEGFTEGYKGKAPDVGAYEHGAERWVPGYRNAVWVLSGGSGGRRQIRLLLAMPPLEAVKLRVRGGADAPTKLAFTPDDWMEPKFLDVDGEKLRLEIEEFELVETVDLTALDPLLGVKIPFRTTR